MRANHTHSLGSKEVAAVLVHEFQRPATAARNAGQGLIRNMDMQSGFFGKQAVEIAQHGTATRQRDAALRHVGTQFGRCLFKCAAHGTDAA